MAWQSLYRRYRPRRFADVRGQDHVVTALRNAVREERVGHAYLFSGPRGTGKTSTARILAKALNCEGLVDGEPDLTCDSCLAIEAGTSFDLHELDAASNNGVDAVRDLITRAAMGTPGRTKVYILDEVHMLSAAASNALLKTLEEPPGHVVFVLATTDPHKVLPTIRSRTQHFEFHLLPAAELEAHVRWVVGDAGLEVDDESIAHVLRAGGGSARDTLSALDQVVAAGGVDGDESGVDEVVAALLDRDAGAVLTRVHHAVTAGREPRFIGEGVISRLRDAFLSTLGVPLDHLSEGDGVRVAELAQRAERPFLTRAMEVLGDALVDMRQAADARITLETAMVRLADVEADTSPAALLERIERLERALREGGAPPPGPPPPPAPRPEGGGPAAAAKQALAATPPPKASAPKAAAAPSEPAAKKAPKGATSTTASDLPSRDELTLAWGDLVLASLPGNVKARYAGGRFVDVAGGAAVFSLPNPMHRDRCEEVRGQAEAALQAHFGRPVPLRLVHEADVPAAGTAAASTLAPPPPDDVVDDVGDLVSVDAPAPSAVDRIADAFPGAQLLQEDDG